MIQCRICSKSRVTGGNLPTGGRKKLAWSLFIVVALPGPARTNFIWSKFFYVTISVLNDLKRLTFFRGQVDLYHFTVQTLFLAHRIRIRGKKGFRDIIEQATKSTLFGTAFSTSLILAREKKRLFLSSIKLRQTLRMGLHPKVFPEYLKEVLTINDHKRRSKKGGAPKRPCPN